MAEHWIPCGEAIRILAQLYDQSDLYADYEVSLSVATDTLLKRLSNGVARAKAMKAEMGWGNPLSDEHTKYFENEILPPAFWKRLKPSQDDEIEIDWVVGDFSYFCGSYDQSFWGSAFNVQIDKAGLPGSGGADGSNPVAAPDAKGAGRPARFDWPDAVLAIFGLIYRGDLKPLNQADVERALLVHLSDDRSAPSESTVRPYAKKIWDEYSKA